MKFITEDDLRDLYRKQPFTNYDLKEGERLTPGARQFLVDRGVDMYDRNDPLAGLEKKKTPAGECKAPEKLPDDRNRRILDNRFDALKIKFLITAKDVIDSDVCLSQQLTVLYRQFAALQSVTEGRIDAPDICQPQEEKGSFEITDFHMQVAKGREVLLLAQLRNEIEAFSIESETLIGDEELQKTLSVKLEQITDILSKAICAAVGGN